MAAHRRPGPRRWHTWLVAAVVLALYVGGARDYVLVLLGDESYVADQFGPGGAAYFAEYPVGYRALWALNIIGGLVAPVMLVLRRRRTLEVALVGLGAQLLLLALTFSFRDRWDALGPETAAFDAVLTLVTAAFATYCWWHRTGTEPR